MERMYKYHVRLYRLYEIFSDKIFYGLQAEEALKTSSYTYPNSQFLTGLQKRKLIRNATRKEIIDEIKDYDFRKCYRRLTMTGLATAKYIKDNKRYLTMFMLRN